jgi:YD repeat-containing protein
MGAGRLVQRISASAPGRATYVYDAVGNRTMLLDSTGRYSMTYGEENRLKGVLHPGNQYLFYASNLAGGRRYVNPTTGGRFTYNYDGAGNLLRVVNTEALPVTYSYDAANRKTVKRLANGARTSFSYDAADRITQVSNLKGSGVVISQFDYRYDNTANRIGVTEASGDRVTWTYDATYQLTRERRSGGQQLRRDARLRPGGEPDPQTGWRQPDDKRV